MTKQRNVTKLDPDASFVTPHDTLTVTIRKEDADYMIEGEWVDERLRRIADALRATLEGEG